MNFKVFFKILIFSIQLFASLLSSDIEPRVEITQKEAGEEKEEENSVNDRKSPAEKSLKLIVKENSGFALGTDRLSFDFAVPIEFHAEEFFGERSDPRYLGVNSEDLNDFEEVSLEFFLFILEVNFQISGSNPI